MVSFETFLFIKLGHSELIFELHLYSRMRYMSHFRAIHRGSFFMEMRTTEVRVLLPDAWGFVCPGIFANFVLLKSSPLMYIKNNRLLLHIQGK